LVTEPGRAEGNCRHRRRALSGRPSKVAGGDELGGPGTTSFDFQLKPGVIAKRKVAAANVYDYTT
jgi:hypothetical protein